MDNDQPAAIVKDIYKSFKLPHEHHSGIKQVLVNFTKRNKGYEVQHVLEDISFEIKKGEFFGIVGRNGSGKSTLLKLLAGIYVPDIGLVQVNGSMTPFIELGVGFNPELTGRENIYLNGALLGFGREEMNNMYDDIVKFAELEKFMDQKLKNYSSGMQVRLAFSIAIQANSDVLILDEVLAVGDEAFQRKCVSVFEQYKARKQTIILVTHDMGVVDRFCSRALMLESGKIVSIGSPKSVSRLYSASNQSEYVNAKKAQDEENQRRRENGVRYELLDSKGNIVNKFTFGEEITVNITWENDDIKNVGLALMSQKGEYIYGSNTIIENHKPVNNKVEYRLQPNLGAGDYVFTVGLFGKSEKEPIDFIENGPSFVIDSKSQNWGGITKLNSKWS